ncbi:MAG: hypothetical protein R3349_00795 [Geminicoccaceae bacterium]|nr:hypothetical protein [Geminicoccaceae bacterium]
MIDTCVPGERSRRPVPLPLRPRNVAIARLSFNALQPTLGRGIGFAGGTSVRAMFFPRGAPYRVVT